VRTTGPTRSDPAAARLPRDRRAATPPSPAHDPEARLAFIRARLKHDAWRSRQWSLAFGTGYATLTAASVVAAPLLRDRASVPDLYVGGFSSIVGFGLIAVAPLRVIFDHEALEASIAADPHAGSLRRPGPRRGQLLIADAKNEKFGRSWLIHSGNVLIGVGALLVLGLGYDRWGSGIANGLGSVAVGELMILTQPHGLVTRPRALPPRRPPPAATTPPPRQPHGQRPPSLGSGYGLALARPLLRTAARTLEPRRGPRRLHNRNRAHAGPITDIRSHENSDWDGMGMATRRRHNARGLRR
jgi:hypothetical protein